MSFTPSRLISGRIDGAWQTVPQAPLPSEIASDGFEPRAQPSRAAATEPLTISPSQLSEDQRTTHQRRIKESQLRTGMLAAPGGSRAFAPPAPRAVAGQRRPQLDPERQIRQSGGLTVNPANAAAMPMSRVQENAIAARLAGANLRRQVTFGWAGVAMQHRRQTDTQAVMPARNRGGPSRVSRATGWTTNRAPSVYSDEDGVSEEGEVSESRPGSMDVDAAPIQVEPSTMDAVSARARVKADADSSADILDLTGNDDGSSDLETVDAPSTQVGTAAENVVRLLAAAAGKAASSSRTASPARPSSTTSRASSGIVLSRLSQALKFRQTPKPAQEPAPTPAPSTASTAASLPPVLGPTTAPALFVDKHLIALPSTSPSTPLHTALPTRLPTTPPPAPQTSPPPAALEPGPLPAPAQTPTPTALRSPVNTANVSINTRRKRPIRESSASDAADVGTARTEPPKRARVDSEVARVDTPPPLGAPIEEDDQKPVSFLCSSSMSSKRGSGSDAVLSRRYCSGLTQRCSFREHTTCRPRPSSRPG